MVYVVSVKGGREGRFHIEQQYPHRIIRWQWTSSGRGLEEAREHGELTGTVRVKYWNLNGNGDERHLEELGLTPIVPGQ